MTDLLSLIYKKRTGETLSKQEIESWISSIVSKNPPPDYQIASLLCGIYFKGMNFKETAHLTTAMRCSGAQMNYKGFPKGARFVDKHSTGGVGDKITLALGPLVAACAENIYFPTITGRGLGHTGGTADKLESIPGFRCDLSLSRFYTLLKKSRFCAISQTKTIVPADRILYALRDVTGTVENTALITASILSKKLAENLDFLLLDLKFGSGAFLPDLKDAEMLAQSLIKTAELAGQKMEVCLTRMDTPLGNFSGNRLEVQETIAILKGEEKSASADLNRLFAERILSASGESHSLVQNAISSGRAYEQFEKCVRGQGGDLHKLAKVFKKSPLKSWVLKADRAGYLNYDVRALGLALVELGAGRKKAGEKIDPDVGFYHPYEAGEKIEKNQEVLRIYYRDVQKLSICKKWLKTAVKIEEQSFAKSPLVLKILKTA